jgi:hypothetical protein
VADQKGLAAGEVRAIINTHVPADDFADVPLICHECQEEFVWQADDQAFITVTHGSRQRDADSAELHYGSGRTVTPVPTRRESIHG